MRHAISATTEWKNSDRTNSSPARSNPHRQAGITHQRKEKINPRPDEPPFLHTEPREEPRAGGGSIGGRVGGETTVLAAPFGWRTTGARSAADEHGAAEKVCTVEALVACWLHRGSSAPPLPPSLQTCPKVGSEYLTSEIRIRCKCSDSSTACSIV
ncbi:hypothetical protein SETIT_9G094400v2 [Setaria italica]|uniref:Uncharacterized protein n=1 Tax=Setaria italica TaxID=4555 RepID=A0A368SEQ9_SETIT|nr:hypothetical protein SETIT_9G094400v2 [Setaria italica]